MLFPKFNSHETINRLRLIMAAVIVFSTVLTLAGQPGSFWHNPATAMRGDGLPINNPTNHTFEFFLSSGWQPYLAASVGYLLALLLLTWLLPRKLGLVVIFSAIFGHYYNGSNWLAVHWHMGLSGPFLYGLALALAIVPGAFRWDAEDAVKKLRWVMLFAMFADMVVTLAGQPTGYWQNPQLVYEGNPLSRYFLAEGWFVYLFEQAVIGTFFYSLVSALPSRWGLTITFWYIFAGYTGASNWLFYRWTMGMVAPFIFGCLLSVPIALVAYSRLVSVKKSAEAKAPIDSKWLFC